MTRKWDYIYILLLLFADSILVFIGCVCGLMAGLLPGLWVLQRRRNRNRRQDGSSTHPEASLIRERSELSVSTMDERAFKARQRLDQKLRSVRLRTDGGGAAGGVKHEADAKNTAFGLGSKMLERARQWHFPVLQTSSKKKKKKKVCAVCLENCQQNHRQVIMELSCSHKYHSSCLLPWLNLSAHPHCPVCRTPLN